MSTPAEAGPSRPTPKLTANESTDIPSEDPPLSKAKAKALAKAEQRAARKAEHQAKRSTTAASAKSQSKSKPIPLPVDRFLHPERDEERTVHQVYEAIAPHFSQTRHKPWPLISSFLSSLPKNSIGLDSGAGNGKYIPVARDSGVYMIALDRSRGLLDIARQENGGECIRGDLGFEGWRGGLFDFAISVAAIHHMSTHERRRQAVQALLKPLVLSSKPPYSRFMIYVWAYEQGEASKRKMGTAAQEQSTTLAPAPAGNGLDRDRGMCARELGFSEGVNGLSLGDTRLEGTAQAGAISGERSESKGDAVKVQDVLVPWVLKQGSGAPLDQNAARASDDGEQQVFHRYYHLFLQGELRSLVEEAAVESGFTVRCLESPNGHADADAVHEEGGGKWLRIRDEGWEADNWWIEGEVGRS